MSEGDPFIPGSCWLNAQQLPDGRGGKALLAIHYECCGYERVHWCTVLAYWTVVRGVLTLFAAADGAVVVSDTEVYVPIKRG